MNVLLDECVPKKLRRALAGHSIRTIREMGWAGMKNGALLNAMAGAGFEALLTVDQNLRHQQNLAKAGVAVIVLVALTNKLKDLLPLIPSTLTALSTIQPGEVVEIDT